MRITDLLKSESIVLGASPADKAAAINQLADLMEAGGNYVVTLTARKKASKGYSKITLKYRKSDCLITGLSLEEFSGAVNTYVLSSLRTGETIPPAVFNIPK